jgi:Fic family protein
LTPRDKDVEGVVEMMLDAMPRYAESLTASRLFDWHAALFPTGRSGMSKIRVGRWRSDAKGPMQVVSGPIGKERVHYEVPAAERVHDEMKKFVEWLRKDGSTDLMVKAGVAHLTVQSVRRRQRAHRTSDC